MVTSLTAFCLFAAVYYLLHPFVLPRLQSLAVALVIAVLFAWIAHLPIHGQTITQELDRLARRSFGFSREKHRASDPPRARAAIPQRFAGPLPYSVVGPAGVEGWDVVVANGQFGWFDRKSGLVWSRALPPRWSEWNQTSWEQAKATCQNETPKGFWALPTQPEYIKSRLNGLRQVVRDFPAASGYLATIYVDSFEMMALHGTGPSEQNAPSAKSYGVRCVGLGSGAPLNGYPESDTAEALEFMKGGH
jgi:hypothetical protein